MEEIYLKAVQYIEQGRTSVLATIISQKGSAPRGAGSKCLILEDGSFVGSVGGGILEAKTLDKAKEVFNTGYPARLSFTLKGTDVAETEMLCGGDVDIFLEPIPADNRTYLSIFRAVSHVIKNREKGVMATVVDPEIWRKGRLCRIFLRADGSKTGSLSEADGLDNELVESLKQAPTPPKPMIFTLEDTARKRTDFFIEPVFPRAPLYVFGGGHVSRQIVPLANMVGFQATVIDDRADFANPDHFPGAFDVIHCPFDEVFNQITLDDDCFIVIVTRGHLHDKLVLARSLQTPVSYIGMIGSKRKRKTIYEQLFKEGFNQEDLSRVKSPIGLEIGAETPEEIAVSIVAELIKVRAHGNSEIKSLEQKGVTYEQ